MNFYNIFNKNLAKICINISNSTKLYLFYNQQLKILYKNMNIASIFLIFSFVLLSCIIATRAQRNCNKACTREFNPVCGRLRLSSGTEQICTFANPCVLRVRRCQTGERKLWNVYIHFSITLIFIWIFFL